MKMNNEELPFGSTALKKELLDILKEEGFTYMSPIQAKTIPLMLKKKNVLGLAETGTGKTLSYLLPILNDLEDISSVQAIIISPTVALLSQIKDVILSFTTRLNFKPDCVKAIYSQSDFNRAKPNILLITPTLYKDCLSHYPINHLKRIIIDEGDMVVFDGFKDTLTYLKRPILEKKVSFFSASLNVQDIKRAKTTFSIDNIVDVRETITNSTVSHHLVNVRSLETSTALQTFLSEVKPFKCIVFASKKETLFKLASDLKELNIHYLMVHGDLDKRDIKNNLDAFRNDNEHLLIASDYVSRGLDIPDVECVVSIDLPNDSQYYLHRAGRAGRFSSLGDSYVFYDEDKEETIKKVYDLIRRDIKFDSYTISQNKLKKNKEGYQFKNLGKKDRAESEKLQKKIRHAVNLNKSTKVKPNYKKKVAKAVDLVKLKHRKKIVLTNISKSGGNVQDYHDDKFAKRKK